MEDNPDVGTEVAEVMLICPDIWFMLFMPLVLVTMDTLMFMLLLYMLVFACCPKCGGDCCENMLWDKIYITMSESKQIKLEELWPRVFEGSMDISIRARGGTFSASGV